MGCGTDASVAADVAVVVAVAVDAFAVREPVVPLGPVAAVVVARVAVPSEVEVPTGDAATVASDGAVFASTRLTARSRGAAPPSVRTRTSTASEPAAVSGSVPFRALRLSAVPASGPCSSSTPRPIQLLHAPFAWVRASTVSPAGVAPW